MVRPFTSSLRPALKVAVIVVSSLSACSGDPFSTSGAGGAAARAGASGADGGSAGSGGFAGGGDTAGAGGCSPGPQSNGCAGQAGEAGAAGEAGSGGAGAERTLTLRVRQDFDDATWVSGSDERLRYSDSQRFIEVGTDSEACRLGVRFALPLERGTVVTAAVLQLRRVAGNSPHDGSMQVQVYDAANVLPFSDGHSHWPEDHHASGLSTLAVGELWVGQLDQVTQSGSLVQLVQHVIDKPDWTPGNTIGFVISPESMLPDVWSAYADSSSGAGAPELHISYIAP